METRERIVKSFYAQYAEENRLDGSKQGQVEYLTTMHYIHKYLNDGQKVAEIGAGTGRLSIELAKEGFDVTAVEYSDSNFDKLQKNAEGIPNIKIFHEDAVRLDMLNDESSLEAPATFLLCVGISDLKVSIDGNRNHLLL